MRKLKIIEKKLENRKHTHKVKTSFGSAFKTFRKKRNLTLQEAAENVCSVSYLSKVENNLIHISDEYTLSFNNKYDIDFMDEYHLAKFYEWFQNQMRNYIEGKTVNFSSFKIKTDDHHMYLIALFRHVYQKKFDEAMTVFNYLIDYIDLFSDLELDIFKMLSTTLLFHKHMYLFLSKFVEVVHSFYRSGSIYEVKLFMYYLNALMQIRAHRMFDCIYQEVMPLLLKYQYFNDIIYAQSLYLHVQLYHMPTQTFLDMVDMNQHIKEEDINVIKAKHFYFNGDYDRAKKFSNFHKNHLELYMLDVMIDAKRGVFHDKYRKISTKTSYIYHMIITYLNQLKQSEAKALSFIKKNLLSLHVFSDAGFYLDFIFSESVNILMNNHMYKDAQKITENRNRLLRQML